MGIFLLAVSLVVLNQCLGFALCMRLGFGPPTLRAAWDALGEAQGGDASETLLDEIVAPPNAFDLGMLQEEMDDQLDGQLDVDPYDDSIGEASQSLEVEAAEVWDLDEKFVETSVLKLNIAMMKSGVRATEVDTELRAAKGHADLATIRRCWELLREDCETYLLEQGEAADKFQNRIEELGEMRALGEEIQMANLQQAAQIETTLSNLKHMDFTNDLESANQRLIEEIQHLRVARHALRDSQEVAFLTIARYERRIDKIEKRLYNDPTTKMRNRIGLEATLWQWWEEQRHKQRPMSAVLFDVDAFGGVNEEHGLQIGDRILTQIGQTIANQMGKRDLVARYAGQRFFIAMVDNGPRVALKNAERIRQSIGRITFQHEGHEIRLNTSAGMSEILPDDTGYEHVFNRVEEALRSAKDAGRNRACYHTGKDIEPVESPNLGAEYVEITI
jgi:diguanylate cyclase (GGDEF)-like protein